ncbi:MAG: hypothetical protein ABIJ26_07995 [Candidatus Margulisiibacteriota bacterium]|nr:hypothetical protein [Candidatus Margulisiibacteriota bacterium]
MKKNKKGFSYVYSQEKHDEYKKLSTEQKLEWIEKMNRFLYNFMSPQDRTNCEKLRAGEI